MICAACAVLFAIPKAVGRPCAIHGALELDGAVIVWDLEPRLARLQIPDDHGSVQFQRAVNCTGSAHGLGNGKQDRARRTDHGRPRRYLRFSTSPWPLFDLPQR